MFLASLSSLVLCLQVRPEPTRVKHLSGVYNVCPDHFLFTIMTTTVNRSKGSFLLSAILQTLKKDMFLFTGRRPGSCIKFQCTNVPQTSVSSGRLWTYYWQRTGLNPNQINTQTFLIVWKTAILTFSTFAIVTSEISKFWTGLNVTKNFEKIFLKSSKAKEKIIEIQCNWMKP